MKVPVTNHVPELNIGVGAYTVTIEEYNEYLKHNNQNLLDESNGTHPVTNISGHGAVRYCQWLSTQTKESYRLLTEKEWEVACADHKESTNEIAYTKNNTTKLRPVGQLYPNKYGLYDMLGNVWEWTSSTSELKEGASQALRGGSWFNSPSLARSALRNWSVRDFRLDNVGFRVAKEPKDNATGDVNKVAKDTQVGGNHYKNSKVQPWDVMEDWPIEQQIGALRHGALKYVMRMGTKDAPLQEAQKAKHYLTRLIEVLESATI